MQEPQEQQFSRTSSTSKHLKYFKQSASACSGGHSHTHCSNNQGALKGGREEAYEQQLTRRGLWGFRLWAVCDMVDGSCVVVQGGGRGGGGAVIIRLSKTS